MRLVRDIAKRARRSILPESPKVRNRQIGGAKGGPVLAPEQAGGAAGQLTTSLGGSESAQRRSGGEWLFFRGEHVGGHSAKFPDQAKP